MRDLVVGIDASTTSVKAIAFDRQGRALFEARRSYPIANPLPGHFEQDAEDWWLALLQCLQGVGEAVGAARIGALAIAHQRESFTLIDAAGRPLLPAILWLDERARPQVAALAQWFGREAIREWTGKPPDPTPALYAVAWLAEHRPELLAEAVAIVDTHGFLAHRLTGRLATSTASADPLGLLTAASGRWNETLVEAAGLRPEQLPELVTPGSVIGGLTAEVAAVIGWASGTPVVAGAGDGQAMGLGMGVVAEGAAYLSLGSGVVAGTFSGSYVTSEAFRTMVGPAGGFMLETVLRSGMQLVEWVMRTSGTGSVTEREAAARKVPAGSGNLLLLPYWAGVMSPYWDEAARGAIFGLALDHTPAHLFRAALEGIAFEQALAVEAMEAAIGRRAETIVAAGGGTKSALLMEILASSLDRRISVSPVNEAGALGAAILAGTALGWYSDASAAALGMAAAPDSHTDPVASLVEAYAARKPIYRDLYFATRDIHARLAGF